MSFPRYSTYKPSNVGWVNEQPSHWHEYRGKVLFQRTERPPREEDGIVTAFRDGVVTLRSNRRTEGFTNSIQEIGYQGVRRGDLVIHAMDAFAGAIGVSDADGKSTPVYSVCTPRRDDVYPHYYARLLRHIALTGFIASLSKGIRERSTEFRYKEFADLVLPHPPLAEQRAIAAFLDAETARLDALVAKQEALITTLQEKRRALISHAVTKGLDPAAPMKDSGVPWLGAVPAHWGVTKIKYLAQIGNGSTPLRENMAYWQNGTFPWLTSTVVNDNYVGEPTEFVTDTALKECHLPVVKPNSVLVAITGQGKTRGMAAMLGYTATINQHMAYIETNKVLLNPKFLQMVLTGSYDVLRMISEGAGSTKGALTCEDLANFSLPLPDLQEQVSICRYIDHETFQLDTLIAKAQALIELLREHRTALIAAAVTGQIDVRGYAGTEAGP